METLDNNISESNKIPGSGCDTFTRPEEIQALSKYLGYIREVQDENTQLSSKLLGIPGKTTGKFPLLNELPNKAEELDLSRESQIEKLSNKLISLDKDSSINKDKIIDHLPNTIITLDDDIITKEEKLSDKLITLGEVKEVDELEKNREDLEVNEKIDKLETRTEKLELDPNKQIKVLNESKESLEIAETIDNLDDRKINLEVSNTISKLDDTKENLEVKEKVNSLDNTKEDLEVSEKVDSLDNTKENLEVKEKVNSLDNTKENLEVKEKVDSLDNTKENLEVKEKVDSLDNTKENLEVKEKVNSLDNTKENLEVKEKVDSLDELLDRLDVNEKIDSLDKTLELLDIGDEIKSLDDSIEKLLGNIEDISLDDTKVNLENTDTNISLGDQILTLDDINIVDSLSDKLITIEGDIPEISLSDSLENLYITEEVSNLPEDRIKLEGKTDITSLSSFLEKLDNPISPSVDDDYDYFGDNESELPGEVIKRDIAIAPASDDDYDYFDASNPNAQLYDATIEVPDVIENEARSDNNYNYFGDDESELPGEIIKRGDTVTPNSNNNYNYFGDDESELPGKIIKRGDTITPNSNNNYNYFGDDEDKLPGEVVKNTEDWVKTSSSGNKISGNIGDNLKDLNINNNSDLNDVENNSTKSPIIGKYNLSETPEEAPRTNSDYDHFQNISIHGLSEEELYNEILRFGDPGTKTGNNLPDSYSEGKWYDMENKDSNDTNESINNWYDKIKSLVSAYLSDSTNPIPDHRAKQFEEKLYGAVMSFQDSIKLSGGDIDMPRYKLGNVNNLNPSTYIRWLAEETIGKIASGKLRAVLMKETIAMLIMARDKLEEVTKATKHRLPGNASALSSLVSGGLNVRSAISSVGGALTSALSKENLNPVNRPEPKDETEGTGWVSLNRRNILSEELHNEYTKKKAEEEDGKNKSGLFNNIVNSFLGKPADKDYIFEPNYLKGEGIMTTLYDLAGESVAKELTTTKGTVQDLFKILRSSPYITTADKVVTTMSWGENYNTMTLDSNSHWEIIFEPYVGESNGKYTFLPLINEINIRNLLLHGITTKYNKWIPFSSFDLQKEKLVSKTLGLYDGEISYPTGIEFTNELRLTIVDDQFKSWRTYFETCMYAAVYASKPNILTADDGETKTVEDEEAYKRAKAELDRRKKIFKQFDNKEYDKDQSIGGGRMTFNLYKLAQQVLSKNLKPEDFTKEVTKRREFNNGDTGLTSHSIDRNYQLIAPYKNLTFRCRIYVMTPQKSSITKFDLLLVLKDFSSEYSGEIDSSGTDLTLSFSIVGENPPINEHESKFLGEDLKASMTSRDKSSNSGDSSSKWADLSQKGTSTALNLI